MTNKVDLNAYQDFVSEIASPCSSDPDTFIERVTELRAETGLDLNRLLTSAIGLTAEGGEYAEIAKKIAFQGKPYDEASRTHMIKELGDVMWYVVQGCVSLGTNLDEVLNTNIEKLAARYPDGAFKVQHSENRKDGDI